MDDERRRITVAIAAMGGQGGGVLADWLVKIGEKAGYYVQSTSVPGVAQRTGTTIYYLELFPEGLNEQTPIMALMPIPGDVDVVVAAELAEAGRAVQRGIVTPDRTTLIASSHRYYALSEKSAMGDGRSSSPKIKEAIDGAAKRLICFDMQALAETNDTVISAALFGALAGSTVLPFSRAQFEEAITSSGKAVANNLATFSAAFLLATSAPSNNEKNVPPIDAPSVPAVNTKVKALLERVENEICSIARGTAITGVRRLIDYQDHAYASAYLDTIMRIQAVDQGVNQGLQLTDEVARHLALWMSYEDTIRVADLKIRQERFARTRTEVLATENEVVYLTEYMHPRVEEIADTLPRSLGQWLMKTNWARDVLTKFVLRERKVHVAKIGGFLLLYGIAALRRFRRLTYRYATETQGIERWIRLIENLAPRSNALALELTRCQNLIKGYGDTHARGVANFNSIVTTIEGQPANKDTAKLVEILREAALADENGEQLKAALSKVG